MTLFATIDNNGTITPYAEGEVIITASCQDKHDVITLNISRVPAESIEFNLEQMGLRNNKMEMNQMVTASVIVEPSNTTFKDVYYTVSDNTILNIDNNNNIIAVGYGTATITVTNADNIVQELEIVVPNTPLITAIIVISSTGCLLIILFITTYNKKKQNSFSGEA